MDKRVMARTAVAVAVALVIILGVGWAYASHHSSNFYPTPNGKAPSSMLLTGTAR